MSVYMYARVSAYVRVFVCVCVRVCTRVRTHAHTHTYASTYAYAHTYTYTHTIYLSLSYPTHMNRSFFLGGMTIVMLIAGKGKALVALQVETLPTDYLYPYYLYF